MSQINVWRRPDRAGNGVRSVALALLLSSAVLGGCKPDSAGSGNAAASVATSPATALTQQQQLAAAFAAAFPNGATEHQADYNYDLTFEARELAPITPDGSVVALLADGANPDAPCHACVGRLRVVYLSNSGNGYAPLQPAVEATFDGDGFGQAPDWKTFSGRDGPALRVQTAFTNEGCTDTRVTVYRLTPDRIVKDRRASKPMQEDCSDESVSASDTAAGSDQQSAAGAGQ